MSFYSKFPCMKKANTAVSKFYVFNNLKVFLINLKYNFYIAI